MGAHPSRPGATSLPCAGKSPKPHAVVPAGGCLCEACCSNQVAMSRQCNLLPWVLYPELGRGCFWPELWVSGFPGESLGAPGFATPICAVMTCPRQPWRVDHGVWS